MRKHVIAAIGVVRGLGRRLRKKRKPVRSRPKSPKY